MTRSELDRLLEIAGRGDASILLTGPTGSGKTVLAKCIHDQSKRRFKPFIVVNLASLHEGTIESELFGHERGAFTGADRSRVGRLELAQGGTIFLDEIGDLSLRLQARLLEFLQSKTITPLGTGRTQLLDVRVIAATHRNLSEAVARGQFREDLFHRLRVLSIALPALADRPDEFDEIVHSCLERACGLAGRSVLRISVDAARLIESYDWPGNIRELNNVLEFAALASEGPEITVSDLPHWFREVKTRPQRELTGKILGVAEIPMTFDFQASLGLFERDYLKKALSYYRGRINQTARGIGMSKATLIRRLKAYDLHPTTVENRGA